MIDDTDAKILNLFQEDARVSNAEIARQVGLAPSATLERVRKLQDCGILRGFSARVDPKAAGLGLLAFVAVRAEDIRDPRALALRLAEVPEVLEVHNVAGDDCYIVKLRASDPEALGRLLNDSIRTIPGIRSTRTTIVLETFKETSALPLDRIRSGGPEGK